MANKKLNDWEFDNEEFQPDRDRNEEPKKVFTLNMTFENESDWLDMQEIIEQWDMGWLKGVYRSQAETTNDVIENIQNGTAKATSWRFEKDGSYSYTTGIAHERYNRPY